MNFEKFMNAPTDVLSGERARTVLYNLLVQIVETTPFNDEEQYEDWLVTEVGMTREEIAGLKERNELPLAE